MSSIDALANNWNWGFQSEYRFLLSPEWKKKLFDLVKQMTDKTPSNRGNLCDVKSTVQELIDDLNEIPGQD